MDATLGRVLNLLVQAYGDVEGRRIFGSYQLAATAVQAALDKEAAQAAGPPTLEEMATNAATATK